MALKGEFRDRPDIQIAVLDALVDRSEEGMTVFELRSRVDVDIDELERALAELREDRLILVEKKGNRTVIRPADRVVPDPEEADDERSLIEELRDRLPF
ncbi:MAG: DNA-binding transcriptional ArsR family regulator [Halobacteriales archaeon]|jgi:DNA-binding transcriptional ArsR family regulator